MPRWGDAHVRRMSELRTEPSAAAEDSWAAATMPFATEDARMNTTRSLTQAQLRELEAELYMERARLERSLADHGGESWTTAAEVGNGATGSAAALSVQTQTDARHDALAAALARSAAGSYGMCAGCQEPIPYGRLIVMPEVTYCVACPSRA